MHGQLAREFAETAARLRDRDPGELLDAIVEFAAPTVGCRHAGLMLCGRGRTLRCGRATDAEAARADHLQVAVRQGPCWSSLARPDGPAEILVDDTARESRWPAWNRPMTELGLRNVLSSRLDTVGGTIGFLTWYDEAPHGFDPDSITVAHVLALHAAEPLARALEHTVS
ncbi:GAF domain-containing protein [Kribbella aluminosa]|uniref:GAF domain-containing protein n=1 Tax=Kribbella aluminosa TaxID=416017 RepID=A0ABS4UK80_9ACTN|nr:GAF domain-containing protein [Kribbella aluminosa]MBP2352058.1 GAF domain-containing protein [Kribbella aluminosa]